MSVIVYGTVGMRKKGHVFVENSMRLLISFHLLSVILDMVVR